MAEDQVSREADAPKAAKAQAPAAQAPKAEAKPAEPQAPKKWMTRKDDPTLGPEWETADPTQIDQGHTTE